MTFKVLCVADDREGLDNALMDVGFETLVVSKPGAGSNILVIDDRDIVVGAAASVKRTLAALETYAKDALPNFAGDPDAFFELETDQPAGAVARWALGRVEALHRAELQARAEGELRRAEMRIEYEALIENFETLSRRYGAFRAPDRVRSFAVKAGLSQVVIPGAPGMLTQYLPIQPKGLGEIALKLDLPPGADQGDLIARVRLRHSDIVYETSLSAAALTDGWNSIFLERSISEDYAWADLELSWDGPEDCAPTLCLGPANPLPEAALRGPDGLRLAGPAAMMLWRFVPGVTPARAPQPARPPAAAKKASLAGVLPWDQLAGLSLAMEPPKNAPEQVITVRDHDGVVVVHGLDGADTLATLPLGAGRLERVSALVTLGRAEANPVEMAVGVAPADTTDPDKLRAALGDWVRLGPLDWAETQAACALDAELDKILVVAARMAEAEASSAWAWASVARIELS